MPKRSLKAALNRRTQVQVEKKKPWLLFGAAWGNMPKRSPNADLNSRTRVHAKRSLGPFLELRGKTCRQEAQGALYHALRENAVRKPCSGSANAPNNSKKKPSRKHAQRGHVPKRSPKAALTSRTQVHVKRSRGALLELSGNTCQNMPKRSPRGSLPRFERKCG